MLPFHHGNRSQPGNSQLARQQPDTAIDIEPDTAGRNYTAFRIHSRDTTDWKAVALMHVRHRQAVHKNARQSGYINRLLQRQIVAGLLNERRTAENEAESQIIQMSR